MAELTLDILIVDDEPHNIELLRVILEIAGHRVAACEDGRAALDAACSAARASRPYALILMDIFMPVMDGIEAIRSLRAHPETAETPIMAVSAKTSQFHEQQAMEAGADGYHRKPIRRKEILAAIDDLLRARGVLSATGTVA